jgi:hypothetical protein
MDKNRIKQLSDDGLISPEQAVSINEYVGSKPFSLHWELKTILYLGVMLFATGISILIYNNIDQIGHVAIICAITLCCGACFYYVIKVSQPYQHTEVAQASPLFDYVLLLGSLLFIALETYLQFQYAIFGEHYGIATLVPALVFFFLAYRFDHRGILSLAITALAAYVGVSISPTGILDNDFSNDGIIISGILLGISLAAASRYLDNKKIKQHFTFSYLNYGGNLLFISILAAMFNIHIALILLLVPACAYFIRYAIKNDSLLFLLFGVFYGYIGFTALLFDIFHLDELAFYYFLISCAGVIYFFMNYKKILNRK